MSRIHTPKKDKKGIHGSGEDGSAVKRMSRYYTDLNPNTPIRQHTTAYNFQLQGIHNAFIWLFQNFTDTHTQINLFFS